MHVLYVSLGFCLHPPRRCQSTSRISLGEVLGFGKISRPDISNGRLAWSLHLSRRRYNQLGASSKELCHRACHVVRVGASVLRNETPLKACRRKNTSSNTKQGQAIRQATRTVAQSYAKIGGAMPSHTKSGQATRQTTHARTATIYAKLTQKLRRQARQPYAKFRNAAQKPLSYAKSYTAHLVRPHKLRKRRPIRQARKGQASLDNAKLAGATPSYVKLRQRPQISVKPEQKISAALFKAPKSSAKLHKAGEGRS